jgi:hypothetical protein
MPPLTAVEGQRTTESVTGVLDRQRADATSEESR